MPPARYVHRMEPPERERLERRYRETAEADLRSRCQMILLSAESYSVLQIAQVTFYDQDTVLYWLDRYEAEGLDGLEDRPRSGRPPKSGRRDGKGLAGSGGGGPS